ARVIAGLLRAFARGALLWMGAAMLLNDTLRGNTLAQIRTFSALFLAPEAAAWCVLLAFGARASIENGALVLARGARRLELSVRDMAAIEPWRLPIPSPGVWLRLTSGERWPYGLATANPIHLAKALAAAGGPAVQIPAPSRKTAYARARAVMQRSRLDTPIAKFIVLPLVLAVPAFHLHQHIAYGSGLGEYYTFGLKAYLTTFALWWAAWSIGVVLSAAALRAAIEAGTLLTAALRPGQTVDVRHWLERFSLVALYIGLPAWLLARALGS
ncbi:MAG TPA: apolipoprotein N-acyltransferase, partial [Aquabacterium sp.]|nr:apolipoprotein N-acyltransferase [Aquabacterium sp.]